MEVTNSLGDSTEAFLLSKRVSGLSSRTLGAYRWWLALFEREVGDVTNALAIHRFFAQLQCHQGRAEDSCVAARVGGVAPFSERMKELGGRLIHAWPEDEEAATLLSSLIGAAWSWSSPSHHYGSKIPARDEASFALSLCSDLLMIAARLLDVHPEPVK
jgi:hypothetical protein